MITEKQIENAILDYLRVAGVFAWKNDTVGLYDANKKVFRKRNSKFHMTGQSDILGIYIGKFLKYPYSPLINRIRAMSDNYDKAALYCTGFADAKEHNLENLKLALKHCEVKDSFFESIGISKDELLEVNK